MILHRIGEKIIRTGRTYKVGSVVIANDQSEYEGLRGIIKEIRDGKDKETENVTPDIYCDFDVPESKDEVLKLEKRFSSLYETKKSIDDIVLDCVVMSPDMLVPVE